MPSDLPNAVLELVADHIDSVYQLEILLYVRECGTEVDADTVAREMYLPRSTAVRALDQLATSGFVAHVEDATYRYDPQTPKLAATLDDLAISYAAYRVRIVGAIYSKQKSPLESFADAFRLRKTKPDRGDGNG